MTLSINSHTAHAPLGSIRAIASKSVAHRMLICAAFADTKTLIRCEETNRDIQATVNCLCAMGAQISYGKGYFRVTPITERTLVRSPVLRCGESGSTLRFLLPIVAALGLSGEFVMEGRLSKRPLSPLWEELCAHGISLSYTEEGHLRTEGKLAGNEFSIAGNVSSQFVSGLLFALTLMGEGASLTVTDRIESAPYITMTCNALEDFGAKPHISSNVYTASANKLSSPHTVEVEGDWSNAAFPLCLGIMGEGSVTVKGLNKDSAQGDAKIIDILIAFGGRLTALPDGYIAESSELHGIDIDASQIPDLVPILATVASVAKGETRIYGASRLRLKESDRLVSTHAMLSKLGADIKITDDGLLIQGKPYLSGGSVSSYNDHRIAMSAAVASSVCKKDVFIEGAEAVAKSYISFFDHLYSLGIELFYSLQ